MKTSLHLRHIELRVPDLHRSLEFYATRVGFAVIAQTPIVAELATSSRAEPILRLRQDPAAVLAPQNAAGLFHAALLFPNRGALGGWLAGAAERGIEFDGFSDHGVSEAIYFTDPDGNGLEFYADRPRDQWPISSNGVEMTTRPLDIPALLSVATPGLDSPLEGAAWGHLHLRVTDLDRSERFYHSELGMDVTQRTYPGARFMAADGYHHHVGLNTWGRPNLPQPAAALGLAAATFGHNSANDHDVRDPDGIMIRVTPL